jgi:hypothetical protein
MRTITSHTCLIGQIVAARKREKGALYIGKVTWRSRLCVAIEWRDGTGEVRRGYNEVYPMNEAQYLESGVAARIEFQKL